MTKTNHALKVLIITGSVFLMGYLLESLRHISPMAGDYFTISTELLSLVLSFSISCVTWYTYRRSRDNHSLFLGAAFLVVGLFYFFHLLSYPFMPDFITPNSLQKAAIFWNEAGLVSGILFLASAYVYKDTFPKAINKSSLFIAAIVLSIIPLALTLFFADGLQVIYSQRGIDPLVPGIFLQFIISSLVLYAGYLYSERLQKTGQENLVCMIYGFIILFFSYVVYFFYEYPEHLLRAAGFYFVYLALYKSSIDLPYETLARTDEKLRKATEEKYRNLFDNAHDAIITTDLNDRITSWNHSAWKLFGWTAGEATGKNLSVLIIPEARWDERKQIIRDAMSGSEVVAFDTVNIRKDGTEVDVNVTISPLRAENNTLALSSIVRDITERKRSERELQYRLDFEKLIMNLSTNFINIAPDEIDKEINDALRTIGEFSDIDRSYVLLFSDDRTSINNTHRWCSNKDASHIRMPKREQFDSFKWFSEKMRRRETIYVPRIANLPPEAGAEKAMLQQTPVKSLIEVPMINGGLVIGYLGMASVRKEVIWPEDMIALLKIVGEIFVNALVRKHAEEKLKQSEEKYRTLIDNNHDGIFIIQNYKIHFVNEAFARIGGYTVEDVIGKSFQEFIAPEDKERVVDYYARRLAGEDIQREYEFNILHKDRKTRITVHLNVGTINYLGGIATMGSMTDITERKRAEEALSWELEVNATIAEMSSTLLSSANVDEISSFVLEHAKRLTGSIYGYVGYVDTKTGYLVCPTMTRDMCDTCKVKDKNNILKDFQGLFGWVLINGKSLLTNSPADDPRSSGTPEGHIPIHRFLSAPALLKRDLVGQLSVASPVGNKIHIMRYYDKGQLVGQVALANSDRDYTDRDLAFIERLADLYAIAINRNWTEMQIKESLKEKDVLLREVHHRVKNNMQIISSLLRLQSRYITEEKYLEMFTESQNRIMSMSLIHEKLYQSKGLARIDFDDYIRDLVTGLFQSYCVNSNITLDMDVKKISLGIDSAIPCGLIVNELVTNSLKHAFPEGRKGRIGIILRPAGENMVELMVSDDGVSIPPDVDINKTESLGLHLVTIMVENQLHGQIDLDRSKGTEFRIKFRDVK
ncbi:MAG: PAS domain S-box protein [Candidatus Methanoperedens sp.]|nr:PAS domain S-box protein [Candidatus Methanoperedens sp.]